MFKRFFIIIALFGFFISKTNASYSISRLGKDEGLTSSAINCMVEDNRGFVWVGTKDGLFRFDGNRFRPYVIPIPEIKRNGDKQVTALAFSHDDKLLIATEHCFLVLDMKNEQMSAYNGNLKERLEFVTQLFVDRNNNIWALSYKGITMIEPSLNRAATINGAENVVATHITETSDGTIWLTALDGNIYRYDRFKKAIIPFRVISDQERNGKTFMVSAAPVNNGNIAIATNNKGVRVFNPGNNTVNMLSSTMQMDNNLFIHTIASSDNNKLYIGTENGLYICDLMNYNIQHLTKSFNSPHSISDNAVHSLLLKDNTIWMGTFFGGINVLSQETNTINNYLPVDANGETCGNIIRSMAGDDYGRVWVGSEDCGLLIFDQETRTFTKQYLKWNNETMPDNIQGMDISGDILVVGTFEKGVYVIDVKNMIVVNHLDKLSLQKDIANDFASFVMFASDEECLMGTNNGLYSYNILTKQLKEVEGMSHSFVHALRKDSKGRVWIGTLNDGLFYIEKASGNMTVKKADFKFKHISCLFESSDQTLFVGTDGNGLLTYNPENGKTELVKLSDNADDLTACSILETENGHLWISTTSGIYDYDKRNNVVVTYYIQSKIIPNDHFNYSSSFCDNKGNLYFGTYGGLIVLNPNDIESVVTPISVMVTSIEGKSFYRGSFQDNFFKTSYDKSTFSLFYSCPSNSLSRQIWYRHKIEEIDDDWTVKASPEPIDFLNLPPGTYHVYLQASYLNGIWNNPPLVFTIEVTPPIWKSNLAYLTYLAAIIACLYMALRFYKTKLNKRHEQQIRILNEEKEKEKLQEKIKFFTTVTHEIRTPLTLVMGSVDRLAKEQNAEKNTNIKRLQNNSNRLLNLVNQLLDFRKIETEQLYMNFTDIDIIPVITQMYDDFIDLANKRNIKLSSNSQMNHCVIVGDRESINKIFNNILANAIKFADTYVTVSIEKQNKDNMQYMIVRTNNDGAKIPHSKQKEIFKPFVQHYDENANTTIKGSGLGLPLIKSLAELHGGSFYYDENCDECNSFVLEIPMMMTADIDENNNELHVEQSNSNSETTEDFENEQSETPVVLIVDDEEELRNFVAEELIDEYKVIEASNGKEALEKLRNNNVSLVITDLMMPVMNGMQLCKEIREDIRISHLPIIVLTAKTSLNDHIEALNANADAYIEKPFNSEHLHAQISNLIKNRELLQNLYVHSPYSMVIGNITSNNTDEEFIRKMDEFIVSHSHSSEANEKSPLTVETLASHMAMSTATLYRKVKSVTSLSPKEYMQLQRLKEAARMLKENNLTIKQVAEELGFSNVSHFTQSFMKQFGITPGKFMKNE